MGWRTGRSARPASHWLLLRYFAISALLVVTIVAVVAAYAMRDRLRLKIASVNVPVPPKAAQSAPPSNRTPPPLRGAAPWALSAVPECFQQTSKATGTLAYVLGHLAPGAVMLRPGSVVRAADCVVTVRSDSVELDRRSDRLLVPAPSRLYRRSGGYALLEGEPTGYVLRNYVITK
jgi:hypothetical protein